MRKITNVAEFADGEASRREVVAPGRQQFALGRQWRTRDAKPLMECRFARGDARGQMNRFVADQTVLNGTFHPRATKMGRSFSYGMQ